MQDRLVKELRLHGITSLVAANAFVPRFIAIWNAKFAVPPREAASAHRPRMEMAEARDHALARHDQHVLSKALTFNSVGTKYCVRTRGPARRCVVPR
jgi:hypothetical protein